MRILRRQFIKAVAAVAASQSARSAPAETGTKHLVAYSIRSALDVVKKTQEAHTDFRASDPATRYLGGINQPMALLCDSETGDWILIGERNPKTSPITFDDFVVAVRAHFLFGPKDPGVTIDPRGSMDGATIQDVKFFGGIENTAFGQTCYEADWLMKRIGMKLEVLPVDGLKTYFDLVAAESRNSSGTQIGSRFWYRPALNKVNFVRGANGLAFMEQFRSGIFTEVLFARVGGEKVDNLAAFYDRPSEEFARSFQESYQEISVARPVFARLESLTKLAALAAGLPNMAAIADLEFLLFKYPVPMVETRTEIEVLEHKDTRLGLRVSGGVTMTSIAADFGHGNVAAFRQLVLAARQGVKAVWEFDMEFNGAVPKGITYAQGSTTVNTIITEWNQALFLVEQKRYEAAIALLDNIIDEAPGVPQFYTLRGVARSANGSQEKAILDFDEALSADSQFAAAYFHRGNTNRDLLRLVDAVRDYKLAIGINPNMEAAYLNRGEVSASQGDTISALSDFEKALSLNPRSALAYFNRGLIKTQKGDSAGALLDFDRALKVDSHLAKAYLEKGSLLEATDRGEEAVKCYDRFLLYDLPEEDQARYSKDAVRQRAEELMKDIAMGTSYDDNHHHLLAERIRRARALLGVRGAATTGGVVK
jgi:tetratricopeptide (TPR) repeat protein